MASRYYRQRPGEDAGQTPEADLVEEPNEQRAGEEPEDLLRTTDSEQARRERELRESSS